MSQFRRIKDMDASGFRFRVFDVFPQSGSNEPFKSRYAQLQASGLPRYKHGVDDALCNYVEHITMGKSHKRLAKDAIALGYEGIMLKTWSHLYVGKRSNEWCKVKALYTEDLPVVGKREGTGKYAGTLGALVVMRGDVEVEVGSGFTDAERDEFWRQPPACIEVKYQEALKSGSLRFPVFVRVRDDK